MRRSLPSGEERRGLSLAEARPQVRAVDGGAPRFAGHAAVFDQRTAIGNPLSWGFYEQVAPGAFTKTLAEGDARMLIDHDSALVVARMSAGTLDLAQDKVGLATDAALDERLSYVRDLQANLDNGNITGMSFGFMVVKDDWTTEDVETKDGNAVEVEVRTIREVKLIEVSAVTFPAYEGTDAGMRSTVATALRCRGDIDAIARRAERAPEFARLLDEVAPARSTVIDLGAKRAERAADEEPEAAPEVDERDADDVEDVAAQELTESADEPGESTRGVDTPTEDDGGEPVEATRHRPAEVEARMRALSKRFRLPAA